MLEGLPHTAPGRFVVGAVGLAALCFLVVRAAELGDDIPERKVRACWVERRLDPPWADPRAMVESLG